MRTRNHIHRVFKQCLQAAVAMELRATNPADNVTKPRQKTSGSETAHSETMNVLDGSPLQTLVAGFQGHPLYHVVALAAATGARRGEILALRWRDVNLTARTVRIERALEKTKAFHVRSKAPKNATSRRTIEIDPHSLSRLKELLLQFPAADRGDTIVGAPFNRDALLFLVTLPSPYVQESLTQFRSLSVSRQKNWGSKV